MAIWDDYTNDELELILDCDSFGEVKKRLRRRIDKAAWLAAGRDTYTLIQLQTLSLANIFYPLNNAVNASLLVLLSVIGNITVAILPLTIMTAVLSGVGMLSGIFFMTVSYLKQKRATHETIKDLDFNAVKTLCADELLQRKKIELASVMRDQHAPVMMPAAAEYQPFNYRIKNKIEKVEVAAVFGLLAASAFFATYYCGMAVVFYAFAAVAISSAILGPIGMSVALAAAVGIGIFCAYKHYQSVVREDKVQQFKEYQQQQLKEKRYECQQIDKAIDRLAQPSARVERVRSLPLLRESGSVLRTEPAETQRFSRRLL